ncbi:glutathione peroxidase [Reichenbachiella agarivorans]|uniref:Glutathione peroxidase n=1 Tax=Reichenbachiella agarivorans TaxID=2979464 RepID=A0ABY6CT04_9BACT|nr:glutathione peroxidase [Reichenbachiella agarivorans]UXP32588.1 glutathione peroxidase [Reichenbachiella agarivorans]
MKTLLITLLITLSATTMESTFYSFKVAMLDSDQKIDFSSFKGKKVLVVNVASKCGFTPQYEELQALSERYKESLVVIGMPCDQFAGQELDLESSIKQFCTEQFHVTFPMTTIIDVKGDNQHPVYQWLTQKSQNGLGDYSVKWNFNKFLISEEGQLLAYFPSTIKPLSEEITKFLD